MGSDWPDEITFTCEWCGRQETINPNTSSLKTDGEPWSPLNKAARDRKDGGGWVCPPCADGGDPQAGDQP